MWFENFESHIWNLGYGSNNFDPCLYIRTLPHESRIYLILYVDDILIVGKDKAVIRKLKKSFTKHFR